MDPDSLPWLGRLRALMGGSDPAAPGESDPSRRRPTLRRGWRYTTLQFADGVGQSRMRTFLPYRLVVDYTRTMLAGLLLCPQPRRIGIVGLGGGSQAKFCYRHLPDARIEAAEINPHVIALRRTFRIPDDDDHLQVFEADGARFLRERPGCYDLLLVDAYDETGIPAALSGLGFYHDAHTALTPGGVLASNLYGQDVSPHLEWLSQCFGERMLVLPETQMSNTVALAWGSEAEERVADPEAALALLPATVREELAPELARVAAALRARGG